LGPMRIELRQIPPDGPVALELAEALREEVEARQTDNGTARAETPLAEAVRADSDTLPAYRSSGVAEVVRLDRNTRPREAIRL
jgi:hypothetical protein